MNTSVLQKIETGWVRVDWSDVIDRLKLAQADFDTILDLINNFKQNRRAKDIVICKYSDIPAYVCVGKSEFSSLLDWIYETSIRFEWYELCGKIVEIKKELR